MLGRKKKKLEALFTTGSKGVGVVQSVKDTGLTVNDNPRVKMTFRIEPLDGSEPFEAEKTKTVPRVAIPRAGQTVREQFGDAAATMTAMGNGGGGDGEPIERLQKLQQLRESGAIGEFEFEDKKAQILSEL